MNLPADAYLGRLMRGLVRKGIGIIPIRAEDGNGAAYGLKAHSGSYIALPLSASRFLDKLKECREMVGRDEFMIDEISKLINEDYKNVYQN